MRTMLRSALLGIGLVAALAATAKAQAYYPYYYPSYSYPEYSYPGYGYPYAAYPYGYSTYYGSPYYYYPTTRYPGRTAYSDPYVYARPYSDAAGPRASGHTGY